MSMFDRLDRVTSRIVDRTFSIHFDCHPAASTPNGRPGPDPEREIWRGKGIMDEAPAYDAIETGNRQRSGNDFTTLHAGNQYELSIDRHRFPQAATAKQGDRIQFDDLRKFEVTEVRPDGLARIVFGLVVLR
jgi:hypothetical protein